MRWARLSLAANERGPGDRTRKATQEFMLRTHLPLLLDLVPPGPVKDRLHEWSELRLRLP